MSTKPNYKTQQQNTNNKNIKQNNTQIQNNKHNKYKQPKHNNK